MRYEYAHIALLIRTCITTHIRVGRGIGEKLTHRVSIAPQNEKWCIDVAK